MKRLTLAALVLAIACCSINSQGIAQRPQERPGIVWAHVPTIALRQAQESRLPIVAYVTTENCGYCRKMERSTWSDRRIIQQVEADFIPLKLNSEQHRELVTRLGVRAFPTTILFTPEGKIIHGASGYLPPPRLAGLLRTARPAQVAVQPLAPVQAPESR